MTCPDPSRSKSKIMVRIEKKSSPLRIAAPWMIVLIPLGWGVVQSVIKSVPLFRMSSAAGTLPSSTGK